MSVQNKLADSYFLQDLAEKKALHNNPTYAKLSFLMGCGIQIEGRGSHIIDQAGRRLIAMFDQYGNQSFGYSYQPFIDAISEKLQSLNINSTKILFEEDQIELSRELSSLTGNVLRYSYFANGGGETIDNALKLARAHTRRQKFISAKGCFHGKTFATLSASGRPEHLELFQPMLPSFVQVPFGDIKSMEEEIDSDTAAVLLEPVQAESGVHVPEMDYFKRVRELCTQRGVILIVDEMQTAFGRTGPFFGFENFGIVPDIICIGKAFGGGILPISAVIAKPELWNVLIEMPSTFGSSLGGNPLSCRVAREVIKTASDPEFLALARYKGELLTRRLTELARSYPLVVKAHRGIGMMHGIELHQENMVGLALHLLIRAGITSTYSLYNTAVLRIQPPLVISMDELNKCIDTLDNVLNTLTDFHQQNAAESEYQTVVYSSLSATNLLRFIQSNPNAMDPFAELSEGGLIGVDDKFKGSLGDGAVTWGNSVELTSSGVRSWATSGWLWKHLLREFEVFATDKGGSQIHIRIEWDCGTGVYEPFIAARIAYYVSERMKDLTAKIVHGEGITGLRGFSPNREINPKADKLLDIGD